MEIIAPAQKEILMKKFKGGKVSGRYLGVSSLPPITPSNNIQDLIDVRI